jgi:hypothetical protein
MASTTSRKIQVKFDGDAGGLVAAAAEGEAVVDRFGRSVDKKIRTTGEDGGKGFAGTLKKWFGKGGDDSTKSLGSKLKNWFAGDGSKLLGEGGQISGEAFSSGLGGVLKTPILGPALLAAAAAVVATTAPAAGAIVAGGIVAGLGAGLVGLGVVFAAKSEAVKAVWSKTLGDMGAQMRVLSKPFESTLVNMAGVAKRTFATFKPELAGAFKTLAPAVTEFGNQLGRAFAKLAPAVQPMASAFSAVLKSLGPALQNAVGNVSQGLIKLADSVKKSPDGLADLVKGLGDTVRIAIDIITELNDANKAFKDLLGVSAVTVVMDTLNGILSTTKVALKGITGPITLVNKGLQDLGITHKDTTTWTDRATAATDAEAAAQKKAATPAQQLADKLNRQKSATDALVQSMFKLQNLALGLSGAEINYQQSVDDATAAVKQNGKNLDINTEKGRANRTALNNVASAANAQTQALIDGGKGWVAADKSAETSRQAFSRVAQQMGLSKKQADALAASVIAIPPKKQVDLAVAGAAAAKANVDKLAGAIKLLPNYKTITIQYTQTGVNVTTPSSVGRRASGGPVVAGRSYLVGEQGPELLTMGSTGGHVTNARQTAAALSHGDTYVYVTIDGEQLQGRIDKTVRTNNRNLKRTVGAR